MIETPTSTPDTAPAEPDDRPRSLPGWLHDAPGWRRASTHAAGIVVVIAALALVVAIGITSLVDGTSGGAGTRDFLGAASWSVGAGDFLRIWAAVFFTAHLTPYTVSSAGISVSSFGAGPLLLTGVLVVLSYRAGRALELSAPAEASMGTRACRAALVAVPYGAICLVAFILATVAPGGDSADVVVSPSLLALLTPWLLVGAAAAFGGMTARPGLADGAPTRSAVAGVYGALVGLALLAVLGLVVFTVKLAIAPPSLGEASAPAILGSLVLAVAYVVNAVGLGWGDALGLTLFGQGAYVLLMGAPVVGAVAGGLVVHKRARPLERSAYIAAFALTSTLLCFVATPIATGSTFGVGTTVSSGGSPLVVLLMSSLVATAAVWGAGYVRLANAPLRVPFAVAAGRVLGHRGPLGPLAGASAPSRQAAVPGASGDVMPVDPSPSPPARIHVPRRVRLPIVGVLVLGGGLAATNAVLSSRYSPERTVEAYLAAKAAHDNAGMLSVTLFHAAGDGIILTDRAALDRMDRLPQNHRFDISDLRVLSVTHNGPRATAEVSYTTGRTPTHLTLVLVQNSGAKHLGLYPVWQVQVEAPALTITAPALHGPVFVDGFRIDLGTSRGSSVYVAPGYHEVRMAPGPVTLGDHQVVAMDGSEPDPVSLLAQLSPAGEDAARRALHDFYAKCAAATALEPDQCPNAASSGGGQVSNVHWTLTTDPASNGSFEVDPDDGSVTARGDWEMGVAYDYRYDCPGCDAPPTVEHVSDHDGGSFARRLTWNGSSFAVDPKPLYY